MKKIARVHVENLVKSTKGHFFGVKFTKKDHTERVMNARIGVKKFLKGGENKVVGLDNSYMTVWDKHANGYRTVNLATVKELTVDGEHYKVVD